MDWIQELKELYDAGIRKFYFCDDNFTLSEELVDSLCDLIIKSNMDIRWSALSRVDTINQRMLYKMRRAGCATLALGIESGLDDFHKRIKKTSLEDIKNAVRLIKEAGIKVRTTWIIGLGKTFEDEYNSLQLIKELLPDQVSVHCLIPYPNTDAWDHPEKYNLVIDKKNMDWNVMNMTYSPELLDYVHFKHISKTEIMQLISSTREELVEYGYNGMDREFQSFLDKDVMRVIG